MAPPITLYMPEFGSVRLIACSPPSWMVQLALAEKDVPHTVRRLDFAAGEHRTPEMLALNPRGTIPVLTDGDLALYETFAILEYLEVAHPAPPLLPAGRRDRGVALNRLHESTNLKAAGMQLFAYLMRTPEDDQHLPVLTRMTAALCHELEWWERYYAAGPYCAGSSLSLADLSVFTYLATAVQLGLRLDRFPSLLRFYRAMRVRRSVLSSWPQRWNVESHQLIDVTRVVS